jgi:hypothetical protein
LRIGSLDARVRFKQPHQRIQVDLDALMGLLESNARV